MAVRPVTTCLQKPAARRAFWRFKGSSGRFWLQRSVDHEGRAAAAALLAAPIAHAVNCLDRFDQGFSRIRGTVLHAGLPAAPEVAANHRQPAVVWSGEISTRQTEYPAGRGTSTEIPLLYRHTATKPAEDFSSQTLTFPWALAWSQERGSPGKGARHEPRPWQKGGRPPARSGRPSPPWRRPRRVRPPESL